MDANVDLDRSLVHGVDSWRQRGQIFLFWLLVLILFVMIIVGDHLCIYSILNLKKFVMSAFLNDLSFVHHDYGVCISDGGQSVSNNDSCDITKFLLHLFNGFLNLTLVLFIQSTGSLVKEQDLWIFNENSCKCYSLLLSSR